MSRHDWLLVSLCGVLLCFTSLSSAQQVVVEETRTESTSSSIDFALADIFSDHMVLQCDKQFPIWGTAPAGSQVTLLLADGTHNTTADTQGKWRVNVGPLKATAAPLELIVKTGDETLRVNDVLVGEVWLAGGQSNMEWVLKNTDDAEAAIAAANQPLIRQIKIKHKVGREPSNSLPTDGWRLCSPDTASEFSAVAYYFARELQQRLDVPIGILNCNWGGTRMEPWTSREALLKSETFAPAVEAAARRAADPDYKSNRPQADPSVLYNAMLNPLVGYGIRGAIWYQGESNAAEFAEYRELSRIMINDWRAQWNQGEFPFLFVQLAAWEPGGNNWAYLREAQLQTLDVPNTGMAVTTDIGHRRDIHPRNKLDVGRRLALAARKLAYGEDLVYSGPSYRGITCKDGKAVLDFEHVGGGLEAGGDVLKGFEVCEADREFVPADAKIEDNQVIVWDRKVREPTAVRYNWTGYPEGRLQNAEGLPASPFRTDTF